MHAQNFIVDQRCDGQTIKAVCEYLPEFDRVSSLTFVVKTINTIDTSALVISSK